MPGIQSDPQDLASENLFTRHNPLYMDPYIVFLKACMLFGRVTDYNTRNVNHRGPPAPAATDLMAALDRLVAIDFLANLPVGLKSCLGVPADQETVDGIAMDTDLYMARIVPHACVVSASVFVGSELTMFTFSATITLHNTHIKFSDPQCPSAARRLSAARVILNA